MWYIKFILFSKLHRIQYQADEPNRRAREEEKKRLEFEQDKERLAFQRILLEAQAKNKEWDRMDEVRTKYNWWDQLCCFLIDITTLVYQIQCSPLKVNSLGPKKSVHFIQGSL